MILACNYHWTKNVFDSKIKMLKRKYVEGTRRGGRGIQRVSIDESTAFERYE